MSDPRTREHSIPCQTLRSPCRNEAWRLDGLCEPHGALADTEAAHKARVDRARGVYGTGAQKALSDDR